MFWPLSRVAFVFSYVELVTIGFPLRHMRVDAIHNASWSTPALDGCASNYWHTTCCCHVNVGILKQSQCMCTKSSYACANRWPSDARRYAYPSQEFVLPEGETRLWWDTFNGYWHGWYPQSNKYCHAAPVIHPQVVPREVTLQCMCSSSVGAQKKQLTCGIRCGVDNCKRSNPTAMEWTPLESGRGSCCDYSIWNSDGCGTTVEPIDESHAQEIIAESLKIAESNTADREKAFILPTSQKYVEEMRASFRIAKKKKMQVSRSGAQFFFSEDYKYILKSIHRQEYDVLVAITDPHVKPYLPGTLINEYVLAFEYNSDPWIVVRNSVTPIATALQDAGFGNYYKEKELFDVKPFPITSEERPLLFGKHFAKHGIASWTNFMKVRESLEKDLNFLESVVSHPLVDYSLLTSVFYIDDDRPVLDHVSLPACVEGQLANLPFYGKSRGSILICFSIIDLLMEFSWSKSPENALLWGKWWDWKGKVSLMFDCLGGPDFQQRSESDCQIYRDLNPKYQGVDLEVPTAIIQDAKGFFGAKGFAHTRDGRKFKCCCNEVGGQCRLVDVNLIEADVGFFESAEGCGSLAGSGWHSHLRYAGECMLPKEDVDFLKSEATSSQ